MTTTPLQALSTLSGLQTPLQLTEWLLWYIFILALAVGVVYVGLLLWTLLSHISHEPLAQNAAGAAPRRQPPKKVNP